MFSNLVLIGLAGGTGTILRFLVQKNMNTSLPFGTFAVNIIGCLLAGLTLGYFSRHFHEEKQFILLAGFCGGFTTFSSFTVEGLYMLQHQRWMNFIIYTVASISLGLIATIIGYKITS
jgi:fluoride exporter